MARTALQSPAIADSAFSSRPSLPIFRKFTGSTIGFFSVCPDWLPMLRLCMNHRLLYRLAFIFLFCFISGFFKKFKFWCVDINGLFFGTNCISFERRGIWSPKPLQALYLLFFMRKGYSLITEVFVYHIFFLFGILKWTYYATFAGFSFCTTVMYCYHILMVSWLVDALGYWIKVCEISINNLKTLVKWVPIILFFKCFYLSFGEKCH